ncbi:pyridoxal 5'-phosphate synthase [Nocardiopsis suaedae]|uniref:Pyridoxal 5'-phosphate synthase n=1 Tax=Nocardiopsis suaedae TaxID=3018444 RepID=A0ABT4TPW1_9ACTN|nr:pyridoxal 5'-phosphate synthase [Nocardiopsis suaedae]MDA2806202.1 pyridoxal 5'-phosphate synthase [Nocardiopsis suaedae]
MNVTATGPRTPEDLRGARLPEFDAPPADPVGLLSAWLDRARALGVRDPGAFALATSDERGHGSSRMVQTSRFSPAGIVFATHTVGRKMRDIAANPRVSGVYYWPEINQQVSVEGTVAWLPEAVSDALWEARPVSTHAMSVASHQSADLEDEEALRAEAERLAGQAPLPRPGTFSACEVALSAVEFWHGMPDRLYLRMRYERAGGWRARRLQP